MFVTPPTIGQTGNMWSSKTGVKNCTKLGFVLVLKPNQNDFMKHISGIPLRFCFETKR